MFGYDFNDLSMGDVMLSNGKPIFAVNNMKISRSEFNFAADSIEQACLK